MKRDRIQLVAMGLILMMGVVGCGKTSGEEVKKVTEAPLVTEARQGAEIVPTSVSIVKGKKIDSQCFDVDLSPLGKVVFTSYEPNTKADPYGDVVFLIERDENVLQQLDGMRVDSLRDDWCFQKVEAVSFFDFNEDGNDDIITICSYTYSQDKLNNFTEIRYYVGHEDGRFELKEQISRDATDEFENATIEDAKKYIKEKHFHEVTPTEEQQLKVLADNSSLWDNSEDSDMYTFAVADLNQNGRLEILSASNMGTGLFTYCKYYEVNEAGDGLTKIKRNLKEEEADPDFFFDTAPVYYDKGKNLYYYIFHDIIRNGAAEHHDVVRVISLDKNQIQYQNLAEKHSIFDDKEKETVTFSLCDEVESKITQIEYEAIADTTFAGYEKKEASFQWQRVGRDDFSKLENSEVYELLKESYEGFDIR